MTVLKALLALIAYCLLAVLATAVFTYCALRGPNPECDCEPCRCGEICPCSHAAKKGEDGCPCVDSSRLCIPYQTDEPPRSK